MPNFAPGQRVRVRYDHPGCTWCPSVQGTAGTVRSLTSVDGDVMIDVELDGGPEVPLKPDCLHAEEHS